MASVVQLDSSRVTVYLVDTRVSSVRSQQEHAKHYSRQTAASVRNSIGDMFGLNLYQERDERTWDLLDCVILDPLVHGYEFREKNDPYICGIVFDQQKKWVFSGPQEDTVLVENTEKQILIESESGRGAASATYDYFTLPALPASRCICELTYRFFNTDLVSAFACYKNDSSITWEQWVL